MPREVAYHLLVAEASAWPIASECAFRLRTVQVGRPAAGVLDAETRELADDLEQRLRPRAAGLSIEVLRRLRDGAWFEPEDRRVDVVEHLVRVATRYLTRSGGTVSLRPKDPNEALHPAERAGHWRWLSLLVPADILISALCAAERCDPTTDRVRLTTPHLRQVLDGPLPAAETHLHVGAAMSFTTLWTGLMHGLTTGAPCERDIRGLVHLPFGGPESFFEMLLIAAIVRVVLARFLDRQRRGGGTFVEFEGQPLFDLAGRLLRAESAGELRRRLRRGFARLRFADSRPLRTAELSQLYRLLAHLVRPPGLPARSIADLILADPLVALTHRRDERLDRQGSGVALPETRFTTSAISYLRGAGRDDAAFRLLFVQYLRVRCALFQYLVEEPGTAGMDWFSRHYQRISPLRGPVDSAKYESALRTDAVDLRLGALEARTAPARSWQLVHDEIRAFARQALGYSPPNTHARPEIGLILHFIKDDVHKLPDGSERLHGDPRGAGGARYARWYRREERGALAIIEMLRRRPDLLAVLRGIDVANLELAIPTWPTVDLLQRVKAASVDAAAVLARVRPEWEVAPLRVTQHVGEDFRRLVEGLRHIHEPAEFGLLTAGDRIGHGIALGTDPELWAARARIVAQPAEERLDDLLWELERYGEGHMPTDAGRMEQVRAEAVRLSRTIYRDEALGEVEPSLDLLLEARRLRHDPRFLRQLGYPNPRYRPAAQLPLLVWRQLTEYGVFVRGQRPVEIVATPGEVAMLKVAQCWLRRLLGKMEVTIESNPSSNQVIGDMVALEEHPAFRMRPLPGRAEPDGGSLLVSINVDNPITFASCLADEYAYIYYALIRSGIESRVALEWLEGVRACGWRSRFTVPATSDEACLREVSSSSLPSARSARPVSQASAPDS